MSSLGHITRCRGEVREALLIISILPFLKFAIRKLNKSSSPRQAICTINTVSFFLRLFILISYLPNNWPQNTSNTSRKSCAAVNNKRAFPRIISLDFCLKLWYATLLEGGESFGAAKEVHPSKSYGSGCFPLQGAAAFTSSELNSYCTEPWLP